MQSLLEGRNASIGRKREPTHMRLSGTDRLKVLLNPQKLPYWETYSNDGSAQYSEKKFGWGDAEPRIQLERFGSDGAHALLQ